MLPAWFLNIAICCAQIRAREQEKLFAIETALDLQLINRKNYIKVIFLLKPQNLICNGHIY